MIQLWSRICSVLDALSVMFIADPNGPEVRETPLLIPTHLFLFVQENTPGRQPLLRCAESRTAGRGWNIRPE